MLYAIFVRMNIHDKAFSFVQVTKKNQIINYFNTFIRSQANIYNLCLTADSL